MVQWLRHDRYDKVKENLFYLLIHLCQDYQDKAKAIYLTQLIYNVVLIYSAMRQLFLLAIVSPSAPPRTDIDTIVPIYL